MVPAFLFQDGSEQEILAASGTTGPLPALFTTAFGSSGSVRMATIAYKVTHDGDQWSLSRDGKPAGMSYLSQEAAFEVAGGDLRSGHDVVIQVSATTDPAGARDRGGAPAEGDGFSS